MMTKEQDQRRLSLLGMNISDTQRQVLRFNNLSAETLVTLVEEGFANPDDTQNDSPSVKDFLSYMQAHPNVTAHGYLVGRERSDARVSIEGLELDSDDVHEQIEFLEWNHGADELDRRRSWWD